MMTNSQEHRAQQPAAQSGWQPDARNSWQQGMTPDSQAESAVFFPNPQASQSSQTAQSFQDAQGSQTSQTSLIGQRPGNGSDQVQTSLDGLHLPSYAREADSVLAAEGGRRPLLRLLPWLVLAAMVLFLVLSLARCSSSDTGRVHVGDIVPSAARSDRVAASTSQAYQDNLARYSADKARAALASGDSFVSPAADVRSTPVPVPVPAPVVQPAPARVVERPPEPVQRLQPVRKSLERQPSQPNQSGQPGRQTAGQGRAQARQPDPAGARMTSYLASLETREQTREPAAQLTMIFNSPASVQQPASVQAKGPASGLPGLSVGDILHAVNRVTLDSDAPGPAMVEVVRGPYRGARVIGSFQRLGEHLVLRFSELAARDGTLFAIEGYAIDPATDRTAVRSSVDRHTLERWGGLVAASFLEGFGDAVSRSGTSSYSTVYGSGWSVPGYSLGDEMWIAAGKVGERAANVLDRGFNRAPTVVLESGTAMGVLLMRVPEVKGTAARSARVIELDTTRAQAGTQAGSRAWPAADSGRQAVHAQIAAEQARVRAEGTARQDSAGSVHNTASEHWRTAPWQ